MADLVLTVPLEGQKSGYDGKALLQPDAKGQMTQHGFMACWYASACMVSHYYRPGPRLGLPPVWRADQGLTVAAIESLARAEGLKTIPKPPGALNRDTILGLLTTYGPIWAAGHFLDGYPTAGHAIVVTGVQGPFVLYNDPWEPRAKKRAAEWLSANLLSLPNAMLGKDKTRS
jgi:hypothetical protein